MATFDEEDAGQDRAGLLRAEQVPPGVGNRLGRSVAAAGLVGVFALAGLAAYSYAPAAPARPARNGVFDHLEGKDDEELEVSPEEATKAEDGRKKLMIEGDLGDLLHAMPHSFAKPKASQSVDNFAKTVFSHVSRTSGLDEELTDDERQAFEGRFVGAVVEDAKEGKADQGFVPVAQKALNEQKPVMTSALSKALNKEDLGFKTEMRSWMVQVSKQSFQARLGRLAMKPEEMAHHRKLEADYQATLRRLGTNRTATLPKEFNPMEHWPKCKDVIGRVLNQGVCGSCWVFAALSSADSRLCIATQDDEDGFTGHLDQLSRGFASSCVHGDGCAGGWEWWVFRYFNEQAGIPTHACSPYFGIGEGVDHFSQSMPAPPCPTACAAEYPRTLQEDLFKPAGMFLGYRLVVGPDGKLDEMKEALLSGPIPFGIFAHGAFMGYSEGVYSLNCGNSANHAVTALGWGVEDGVDYMLAQNSWGPDWGLEGRFRIAYCEVTDFTIPGPIEARTKFPLPVPTGTLTTSTTPAPPPPDPNTQVCQHDPKTGCVTSPNYPDGYWNAQKCEYGPDFFGKGKKIVVEAFDTERGYDILSVNGKQYSGTHGPNDIVPTTNIVWSSDFSGSGQGWKICPEA